MTINMCIDFYLSNKYNVYAVTKISKRNYKEWTALLKLLKIKLDTNLKIILLDYQNS